MSLLGLPTLLLAGLIALVSPAVCVLLWDRVRGGRAARATARLGLIAFAQLAALSFTGLALNDYNDLYGSWSDLAGAIRVVAGGTHHAGG